MVSLLEGIGAMATRDTDIDKDLAALREDLGRLREDISSVKSTIAAIGKRSASEAKAAGSARIAELRDELEQLGDNIQARGHDALAGVERTVHDRPLTSLLAAFGLGLVLSRFLDRR